MPTNTLNMRARNKPFLMTGRINMALLNSGGVDKRMGAIGKTVTGQLGQPLGSSTSRIFDRSGIGRRYLAYAGVCVFGALFGHSARPAKAMATTCEIANMTWLEVEGAVKSGMRTVIVPSGGLEQNGPHMIIAKHDFIVRWAARRIAAELGDALVAPVVSYVPEGEYEPPTGNMAFPGTLGVPPDVFASVLEGIARSLKSAGFERICFIADHGPSLAPQAAVASKLTVEWRGSGPRVLAIDSYYADAAETAYLREQGETDTAIGQHASIADTSELMAIHPDGVDLSRLKTFRFHTGVIGDAGRSSVARGDALMALKIKAAVAQIREASGRRTG